MKTSKQKNNKTQKQKGIALLFVVLLTSVLLMVAIGISNISYKELLFSVEARDSDKAFFAADTGMECALSLDKIGWFGGTPPPGTLPECSGLELIIPPTTGSIYQFIIPFASSESRCVQINIDKALPDPAGSTTTYTQISALGYNVARDTRTGAPDICMSSTVGANVVTRALQITYANGGATGGSGGTGGTGGGGGGSGGTILTPTVTTNIPDIGGLVGGTVTDTGGSTILFDGVDYSTTSEGPLSPGPTGAYTASTFGFAPLWDTTVSTYYKAWVETSIAGPKIYGNEQPFAAR